MFNAFQEMYLKNYKGDLKSYNAYKKLIK